TRGRIDVPTRGKIGLRREDYLRLRFDAIARQTERHSKLPCIEDWVGGRHWIELGIGSCPERAGTRITGQRPVVRSRQAGCQPGDLVAPGRNGTADIGLAVEDGVGTVEVER